MEAYFNELCFDTIKPNTPLIQASDISRLASLYQRMKEYDINTCRIDDKEYSMLVNHLTDIGIASTDMFGIIYSFFQTPFEGVMSIEIDNS